MFRGYFADIYPDTNDGASNECNLLRFCPRFIAQLAHQDAPHAINLFGSMMIVDISGFTRKSAALGAAGRVGIDELRNVTRDILASYLNVIEHYDGEVVAFAGDALICLFHTSDRHTMQAVRCAFELKDYAASGLTTHAAVVTGEVSVAILGGYEDRWSYLVGGECLNTLGRCLDAAHSSQLVICGETFEKVKKCITNSEEVSNGLFRVNSLRTLISTTPRAVRSRLPPAAILNRFIPAPILSAIAANTIDDLAELRVISTLFLKLDSFSSSAGDLMSLQPLFFNYQCIISECGGMLRQFLVDDKGCVLIVLFGVPTAMHLSNCCRAVRCAALLMEQTRSMSHVCSIGITTGKAYCGLIGSSSRQEYVAMGKVVNLAARLMSRAENGLLTDAATYACLRDNAAHCFEEEGAIELKGFDESVVIYRLTAETALFRALIKTTCVARYNKVSVHCAVNAAVQESLEKCQHMAGILSTVESVALPHPHFCVIHGAAGYGKSVAVQKYCEELGIDSIVYTRLRVRANAEKHSIAAMILCSIFQQMAPVANSDELTKLLYTLVYQCMGRAKAVSMVGDLLNYILDCRFQDSGKSSAKNLFMQSLHFSSKSSRVHVQSPQLDSSDIVRLLQFVAMRYQVASVIVEGAEHLSDVSWEQLHQISSREWPVVMILSIAEKEQRNDSTGDDDASDISFNTPRTHSMLTHSRSLSTSSGDGVDIVDDSNMARLIAKPDTAYIRLAPMTFDEVVQVVQASMHNLPISVMSHIYDLSQGNHFWVALLIRYVMELGINEFSFMMSNVDHRDVLATAILSRLQDKQYHIAKVASVIGIDFELSTLRSILPVALKVDLKRSMDELVDKGVLQMIGFESYSFQSALLRDLIYQLIPPSNVSTIHLDVAQAMEAANGDAAMIIYHYFHCGEKSRHRGFSYGLRAASVALQAAHFSLAIHYLFMTLRVSQAKRVDISRLVRTVNSAMSTIGKSELSIHTEKQLCQLQKIKDLAAAKLSSSHNWSIPSLFRSFTKSKETEA